MILFLSLPSKSRFLFSRSNQLYFLSKEHAFWCFQPFLSISYNNNHINRMKVILIITVIYIFINLKVSVDESLIDFESRKVKERRAYDEVSSGKYRHPNFVTSKIKYKHVCA